MTGIHDRRALPGRIIDLARDGVAPRELCRDTVYRAAARVALSAVNARWTFPEFDALLADPGSHLGNQLRSGGRGRPPRPPRAVAREIRKAWTSAERKAAGSPAQIPIEQVKTQVAAVRARLQDLTQHTDAVIMECWANAAERHTSLTPVLPIRTVTAATGLTFGTAVRGLAAACAARLLDCTEHGEPRPGGRASRYALGAAWNTSLSGGTHPLSGGNVFHHEDTTEMCSTTDPPREPPDDWDCASGDCPPPETDL